MNRFIALTVVLLWLLPSCGAMQKSDAPSHADALPLDLGGRVYDKFYVVTAHQSFVPDKKNTKGVADGTGGPSGDGSAVGSDGKVLLNDGGHGFRLKNFFGWDLKGRAGIYGPDYKNKKSARSENLMSDARTEAELLRWLQEGSADGLPAYKHMLKADHLRAAVGFIVAMRDGKLPRADDIWQLAKGSPGNYKLREGADVNAGKGHFEKKCSGCHGANGTRIALHGGAQSLGAMARGAAYEAWFKILAGHPGTKMRTQVPAGLDRKQAAKFILDTLAALCDRTAFPRLEGGKDVKDGDPRCGAYLK